VTTNSYSAAAPAPRRSVLDDLDIDDGPPAGKPGFGSLHAPHARLPGYRAGDEENAPPLPPPMGGKYGAKGGSFMMGGAKGGGMGGGIASTLAAARNELHLGDMPQPVRLQRPAGGVMLRGGPMVAASAGVPQPMHLARGGSAMGGMGARTGGPPQPHRPFDDADDIVDIDALPTLDGRGGGGGGGKPTVKMPLINMKPPAFEDDIDDEAMAAEEAAFLAKMKAKRAAEEGSSLPPKGTGGAAVPLALAEPTRAPPVPPGRRDEEIDDLSEEELL